MKNIAIVGRGHGGSPEIAALNAAMPGSPYNDSPESYVDDMVKAGYGISDRNLLLPMCEILPEAIAFLEEIGITFAKENGFYKLRQTSGCRCPRSLCDTGRILGKQMLPMLMDYLEDSVTFVDGKAVRLLTKNGRIAGAVALSPQNTLQTIAAPVAVAAWGGVGDLYPHSTYAQDVDGSGLAAAFEAGLSLVDIEFLEYEPLVTLFPQNCLGEMCPTAMLGEGAYLLNTKGERFLLAKRPEGEAGAAKTLINKAIAEERAAGRTTERGGVFADMRYISLETLKAYPWFYNRMLQRGFDVKTDLLEIGPAAHSHSGGIVVTSDCGTELEGLYAVGEASGGYHGACRMGGNAASQTVGTGYICAEHIAARSMPAVSRPDAIPDIPVDPPVRRKIRMAVHQALDTGMNLVRTASSLRRCLETLAELESEAAGDVLAASRITGATLMCHAALAREESRGTHTRGDFPEQGSEAYSLVMSKGHENTPAIQKTIRGVA
ncbi:L-aspartate oxidase [Betaproteobacteria bacterium]|nr:L-aspartate oxidase [Betaproteobacteria bacterium]